MELFSKQDSAVRQSLNAHINQRWGQLYELEKEWGERALKYLLLTNSGGAIATLGFLGASPTANAWRQNLSIPICSWRLSCRRIDGETISSHITSFQDMES